MICTIVAIQSEEVLNQLWEYTMTLTIIILDINDCQTKNSNPPPKHWCAGALLMPVTLARLRT